LFTDGIWSVATKGLRVLINDVACDQGTLRPNDVLTFGRHRYRINYRLPLSAVPVTSPPIAIPAAPPQPPVPVRPPESAVLGTLDPCGGGRTVMLRKPKVTIGRAPNCDVVVPHKSVSSRHCQLDFISGYWQSVDQESRNGTFVDGVAYRVKWLFPGNVLGISTHRFRIEYVPQGERPSTAEDDVPVLSRKSLMECAGLTEEKLDSLTQGRDGDEPGRRRWRIDE
jgi:adenylate cyclase